MVSSRLKIYLIKKCLGDSLLATIFFFGFVIQVVTLPNILRFLSRW